MTDLRPALSTPELVLPREYLFEKELARGTQGLVVRALRRGERVVLRLDARSAASAERRSELAVLAAVAHPGLARLVDHGTSGDGRTEYVARGWIEGPDLLAFAAAKRAAGDLAGIGRVVAALCAGLDVLHRAGFVHGDLKPTNVIVAAGDRPVITDFGLSRAHGTGRTTDALSGSLFALAPEQLAGEAIGPRADLFALGVLLHQALIGRRTSAREFYARFPEQDFFEATGTSVADLPEWARDLVARLVQRDPRERPASAALVGRILAGRLGIALDDGGSLPMLEWPADAGREEQFERWLEEVCARRRDASEGIDATPRGPLGVEWWTFPRDEDPHACVEAVRLRLALAGCPTQRIEIQEALHAVRTSSDLDRWANDPSRASPGTVLFVPLASVDPAVARAVASLARAIAREGERLLVIAAPEGPPACDVDWIERDVPAVSEMDATRFLTRELETDEPERLARFAAALVRQSGGSASRLAALLREAAQEGSIVWGRERPRLRPGPLPERIGRAPAVSASAHAASARLSASARKLLAALHVAAEPLRRSEAAPLAGLDTAAFASALGELSREAWIESRSVADKVELVLRAALDPRALALGEEEWREIHRRRAVALEARGASQVAVLAHRYRSEPGAETLARALEELAALRDRGLAELAIDLGERIVRQAREAGLDVDPRLFGEQALAWTSLGQPDRGLLALQPIETRGEHEIAALVERVRGHVDLHRHEYEAALAHFESAADLDPRDGGDAIGGQARLFFEMRRDAELERLHERAQSLPSGAVSDSQRFNLDSLLAMSLFRRGQTARARAILEPRIAEARSRGDRSREAALAINLATIARRTGDVAAGIRYFERAIELHEADGSLTGLAQALALIGGALRESGDLVGAESPLASALAIRERVGDQAGAAAVRGMLGLLHADRGHARAALDELARSAEHLRAAGRSIDAAVLEARADEVGARVGLGPISPRGAPHTPMRSGGRASDGRAGDGLDADPRILVARARAAWLRGDSGAAQAFAARAEDLSARLELAAPLAEARLLLDWLVHWQRPNAVPVEERRRAASAQVDRDDRGDRGADDAPLVRDDARVLALLSGDLRPSAAGTEASEFAARLAAQGRDDRAARLYLGVAARCTDADVAAAAERWGQDLLRRCALGLVPEAAERMLGALLAIPDPWPADLVARVSAAEETEDQDMDVVALLEINHRLVQQEDLDTLLGTIVESALSVTGAERGFVVLEEQGELRFDTALDSRRGGIAAPDLEVSKSIVRQVLDEMRPLRLSNAVDDPQLGSAPSVSALELRSILCAPFTVDAAVRGVIYIDHRLRQGAFSERAERLLALLADQAALALRQVRRVEEIRRLNRELNREVAHKESDLRTARAVLREARLALPPSGLVGSGPAMRAVHALIERAAQSRLTALVVGESGTGKELASRALHDLGPRAKGEFVGENCAALPAPLIESELFGTKKGAFTGAEQDRAGLFERADGGTLFLDEIGDLSLELQAKLLRVLETGEVRRLGDNRSRPVDFRLVAATNRDLEAEVAGGGFRADLFYRLDGLRIRLPALSEHVEDIPELVDHFLRLESARSGRERKIAPAVLARLCRRVWPGNVRELANEVARLCVLSEGDVVDPDLVRSPSLPGTRARKDGGIQTLAELERQAIERAIEAAGGDKRKAAALLGISRAKIYQRIKEWRGVAADEIADGG